MEASFQLGYEEGHRVFNASQTNNLGKDMDVTSDSTFLKTEFHAVLMREVVIPDLQPCIYLVQHPFPFRELQGSISFLSGGSYLQWNIRV